MTAPGTLRLASYNIRKCIGLDRRRRADRTLDVMAAINADVLVLQEADKRLGQRPSALPIEQIEDATGLRPVALSGSAVSLGWHGNALLLGPRTNLLHTEHLALDGLEPRGAVLAELDTADGPLRVVATHLGLLPRDRMRQLRHIRAWLNHRPDMPTTILGDFNDWSSHASQIALGRAFQVHAPGRSFHAARALAALDRIATNSRLEVERSAMMNPAEARRASDHLPVWLDVRLVPAPKPAPGVSLQQHDGYAASRA